MIILAHCLRKKYHTLIKHKADMSFAAMLKLAAVTMRGSLLKVLTKRKL